MANPSKRGTGQDGSFSQCSSGAGKSANVADRKLSETPSFFGPLAFAYSQKIAMNA